MGARDFTLLRGLYESRVATVAHIARIDFAGRAEMAKKRLQKLKSAGLIRSRARSTFERARLFITQKGIDLLARTGALRQYGRLPVTSAAKRTDVSASTLAHELAVMDVKAAFHGAAPAAGREVVAFSTWPALNRFESTHGTVKPDALVRLKGRAGSQVSSERRFYLELDRSTETARALVAKAHAYRTCRIATRCVAPLTWDSASGRHEFTVLVVVPSEARLASLARRLLAANPPVRSLVWIATLRDVVADPFGPIWVRPMELESPSADLATIPRRRV